MLFTEAFDLARRLVFSLCCFSIASVSHPLDLESIQKVHAFWRAKGGVLKPIVPVLIDPRKLRAKSKRRRVTGKGTDFH
jgi:hypothetical protein